MLKRASFAVFSLGVLVLLTGMGGSGAGFERVPRVDKNFTVIVTDASGQKIKGEKLSWEGRTRFSGYMGLAEVNLPFDRVNTITVGERRDRKVRVTARLFDGSETELDIEAASRCYGETTFGSFMLTMGEIKSIRFTGMK